MSYYDIYTKRLNRYGLDYQSRIQGKREDDFEHYLLKSVYRVNFTYNGASNPATLEKYKQTESEVIQYLLTRIDLNIPNGTILNIPDKDNVSRQWMVYYREDIKASGYNRYIVLKMNQSISWTEGGTTYTSYAYIEGPASASIVDIIKSNTTETLYSENNTNYSMIMPLNINLKKNSYFELVTSNLTQGYRVTGFDVLSTNGVEYVTLDPTYLHDDDATPATSAQSDNFWFKGGVN